MKRLLSRIFCLLLIAVMLMPAIPAPAEAAEETYTYIFAQPEGIDREKMRDITADNYKSLKRGDYSYNWYWLEDSFGTSRIAVMSASSSLIVDTVGAHWVALVIDVPKSGNYSLKLRNLLTTKGGVGDIYLLPATKKNKEGLKTDVQYDTSNAIVMNAEPIATVDFYGYKSQINHAVDHDLKSMYLDAGEHILIFKGKEKGRGNLCYMNISRLTLTKEFTVSNTVEALNKELVKDNGRVNIGKDLEMDDLEIPSGVTLDLNGHKLTCKSLIVNPNGSLIDSSEGKGALICKKPIFSNIDEYLPLYDSKVSGYRLYSYTVSTSQETAKTYGKDFNIQLKFKNDDAYDLMATGKSGLEMDFRMTWTNLKEPKVYTTEGAKNSVIMKMGKTEKPFVLKVRNMDKLNAQILSVTPVLRVESVEKASVAVICPVIAG